MNLHRRRAGRIRLDPTVPRSRIRTRDLIVEAWSAVTRRPVRSLLTALGTIAGTGAFTATLGIAATASAQISARFDLLKATEVRVQDANAGFDTSDTVSPFPTDTDERLQRLNGVNHAGLYWTVQPSLTITRLPGQTDADAAPDLDVIAATPGAIDASLPTITGRSIDAGHLSRTSHVALIGAAAARQLGITRIDNRPAVYLNDTPFTLIGIITKVERNPDLLLAITIPRSTAERSYGPPTPTATVLIDTKPGAAQLIGSQAALALRPQDPDRLEITVPPEPKTLRQGVENDTKSLYLTLAILALAIGTIGITNATLVAVLERTHEIGLRRALGALPRHIALQLVAETALLGTVGGLLGSILGTLATITTAILNHWTATTPGLVLLIAPVLGTITGVVAGLQPAYKASRPAPVESLRA